MAMRYVAYFWPKIGPSFNLYRISGASYSEEEQHRQSNNQKKTLTDNIRVAEWYEILFLDSFTRRDIHRKEKEIFRH